ncbi:bifunctional tRNA (5-methylaminomethyl-2-thiouridine)(34)-methyltransferase MnmD/FAD-dependent 5-carboxymethylaminomethyl-2-thiouridine(34) oxidoreductase MnmC [Marinospirillum perlucidum]|uniref:bifunctional tRNA (5-methylaminomethyl-2-thiouridine)(34)-methyltransferase MnmD/FAD-dependent 5-carboxymethylaminomethyl-2-thiouridine(34) oxidoreductase MnmC n=1 Tax=Marinospirillum perlucidum TaxID=1982602 RepID=UPI000DF1F43D|nr:bifunctional tRNA (5-methylaminomethyl-2-thiouridine)(34)-methyltransferase MnmD/FAD-dependent 5-carboxymethylaminomethyl-2-thiouridine(34) oxidoreductase MnmC [Marinospirillum perlucidum]
MSDRPGYRHPRTLETARIDWQKTTPVARDFEDVYFSRDQGPAETRYVFLEQNHLGERWQNWEEKRAFVIGETGFGTGLNLLVAMQEFLNQAPPQARLHWITTELYPLQPQDLRLAHSHWPELAQLSQNLQDHYPLPIAGFHRLHIHPRITLDLLLGDAAENLSALAGKVDAWCLDGFAPGKNPGMWTPELFQALARASHDQTTFATFTCAGPVKRGLKEAGFELEKVPGYGRKREMLRGRYQGQPSDYGPNPSLQIPSSPPPGRLAIIGGGLSGLATAEALNRRGLTIDLYEADEVGSGGSGNRQGVLYIKLAVANNPASCFYLTGLEYSRRWLQRLDPEQKNWQESGVLQLAVTDKEKDRQQRFLDNNDLPEELVRGVSQDEASQLAATATAAGGLFYSRAGWVKPGELCHHLAAQLPATRIFTQTPVDQLQRRGDHWILESRQGQQEYDTVILASAFASRQWPATQWLPIKSIRGQVSHLPLNKPGLQKPQSVVCGGGYVSPPLQQMLCFGASFNLHTQETALNPEDHLGNLEELSTSLPHLLEELGAEPLDLKRLEGRVGFRCTSPDYLPIVGPAPDHAAWEEQLQPLTRNALWKENEPAPVHPGLWLLAGQGSRGLASIPLTAELLASQICSEPLPLADELVEALHPGRFIIRQLKRRQKQAKPPKGSD